jgi:hypothetical protein
MLHFITRIVICSFGFRRVLPSHLIYYLGGSFFFVSAQTYITPTILAILAYLTFRLLYGPVAKCAVEVVISQIFCLRTDNFNVVFQGFNIRKRNPCLALEAPWAAMPLLL